MTTPRAPASSTRAMSSGLWDHTRARGTAPRDSMARNPLAASGNAQGPCSISTVSHSNPSEARTSAASGEARFSQEPTDTFPAFNATFKGFSNRMAASGSGIHECPPGEAQPSLAPGPRRPSIVTVSGGPVNRGDGRGGVHDKTLESLPRQGTPLPEVIEPVTEDGASPPQGGSDTRVTNRGRRLHLGPGTWVTSCQGIGQEALCRPRESLPP